jgi:hypothetical protein
MCDFDGGGPGSRVSCIMSIHLSAVSASICGHSMGDTDLSLSHRWPGLFLYLCLTLTMRFVLGIGPRCGVDLRLRDGIFSLRP